ncbi:unnamed protein product [Rotaria socialis]|uniref:Apple domain-containing protein n=1 Tax=Rotaria socialis TaxID=392032 RepID=A0A817MM09_9BILA|nr:unnamed protein product [Rotaria socialis]CAF4426258.1 unnamed protein product [Rotaria socialis]CAF4489059.1 unnamed protein product [Rotaria socialis]
MKSLRDTLKLILYLLTIIAFLANIYPDFVRQDGVDYVGNDIPPFPVEAADYASCVLVCAKRSGCNAVTYKKTGKICIPKTRIGKDKVNNADAITGYNRKFISNLSGNMPYRPENSGKKSYHLKFIRV